MISAEELISPKVSNEVLYCTAENLTSAEAERPAVFYSAHCRHATFGRRGFPSEAPVLA